MHRALLESWLPCLMCLAIGCTALWLVVRVSGAKLQLARLRQLHRCEDGGVQSLSFVITLPLFIMILMFIVQMSQLMIGMVFVHYAAFAAARAAIVWIPSEAGDHRENIIPNAIGSSQPVSIRDSGSAYGGNMKYDKIFQAAAMAVAPVCPSRDVGIQLSPTAQPVFEATQMVYASLVPDSVRNSRIPERLHHKIAFAYEATSLRMEYVARDIVNGPSYNPWPYVDRWVDDNGMEHIVRPYDPYELDWEDPITITVTHRFALLPGPGRLLAKYIVRADGQADDVSPRIGTMSSNSRERIYTTPITASITLTNEGFQSVFPYEELP